MQDHKLYYATSRTRKFEEVKEFVLAYEPSINLQRANLDIDEIQSLDQRAVAIDKAKKAWRIIKKPLLIDDEGIFFDQYPLFPGTFSKYIAQALHYEGLLKLTENNNKAAFILTMVYIAGDEDIHIFEAKKGGIAIKPPTTLAADAPALTGIFKPEGSTKVYAQLQGIKEIEAFSPRISALKQFLTWYKQTKRTA